MDDLSLPRQRLIDGMIGSSNFPRYVGACLFSSDSRVEAIQVEIEVNAGSGDPGDRLVGLPDAAVREQDR